MKVAVSRMVIEITGANSTVLQSVVKDLRLNGIPCAPLGNDEAEIYAVIVTLYPNDNISSNTLHRLARSLDQVADLIGLVEGSVVPAEEPYDFDALKARCDKIPEHTDTRHSPPPTLPDRPIVPPEADPLLE